MHLVSSLGLDALDFVKISQTLNELTLFTQQLEEKHIY